VVPEFHALVGEHADEYAVFVVQRCGFWVCHGPDGGGIIPRYAVVVQGFANTVLVRVRFVGPVEDEVVKLVVPHAVLLGRVVTRSQPSADSGCNLCWVLDGCSATGASGVVFVVVAEVRVVARGAGPQHVVECLAQVVSQFFGFIYGHSGDVVIGVLCEQLLVVGSHCLGGVDDDHGVVVRRSHGELVGEVVDDEVVDAEQHGVRHVHVHDCVSGTVDVVHGVLLGRVVTGEPQGRDSPL
jgi:hypothetical protein